MPLTTQASAALVKDLSGHVATIAADLRERLLQDGPVREAGEALQSREGAGGDYAVWTDLLSRRIAVLWVLKSVYVRVLEDRGMVRPQRILDTESQQLFERLAPNLGESAYLEWAYRDLAQPGGGLPELFAPQAAELLLPADEHSRALLAYWRERDPDTDALCWSFADERFDGQLMGDLYQDLDPVVKGRFALLQTPDFVRDFILDNTLSPALETWPADEIRLLDPACGSGHFLLEAFRRLVEATASQHPEWGPRKVVDQVLPRVVGIDLNDYACALARARLVMKALELAGGGQLGEAGGFHPAVFHADGLEQLEADVQLELMPEVAAVAASRTPEETRAVLRPVLVRRFHVVVANPPYITEKDKSKKAMHRGKEGPGPGYKSAYRLYSLASPFTERAFQLATPEEQGGGGFVGYITSNNFMKRSFGKALIEKVMAGRQLTGVVDTSGAFIPGHGTPTVILFARNARPSRQDGVRAVLGKRGEPCNPPIPAEGRVWASIERGWSEEVFENEFVGVGALPRDVLDRHPWSLKGGGALDLKLAIDSASSQSLLDVSSAIGPMCITKQDEVFVQPYGVLTRHGVGQESTRTFGMGQEVRDWSHTPATKAIFPYDDGIDTIGLDKMPMTAQFLWPFRAVLEARAVFGGDTFRTAGRTWWEYGQIPVDRFRTPLTITFAFVATHNHFVLDRGGKVFNRTAPVIKLPPEASLEDHLALLGLLNSSTAAFWMRQVYPDKGRGGVGGGIHAEKWSVRLEYDATKLKLFPLPPSSPGTIPYAAALDSLATERTSNTATTVLSDLGWTDTSSLRAALNALHAADFRRLRRMVALQEELDWLVYNLYGLDDGPLLQPDDLPPLAPGARPFELTLAAHDQRIREAIERGEDPGESPTAWFERHGWAPLAEPPGSLPATYRTLVQDRLARTAASKSLTLLERPVHKRRWYRPDHAAEEHQAMQDWLLDRLEDLAKTRTEPWTVGHLAATLQADSRADAVLHLYTGQDAFDAETILRALVQDQSLPDHPQHLYKPKGLT